MKNVNKTQQIAVFKALADPVRLEIIQYLKQSDHEVSCGEVGRKIDISKTSGSYHFKLLQVAGLINARKEAREKYVSLNQATFDKYVTNFYKNI
ncbi:ArsR/SmtB family transcription factor [Companilactobacillus baiquanensis]|uniref:ArsR/SmtB family transcription factor n=1 Tax=Companilactobacillus baiquanensis TaxID=2486005 RepID=A0ABW1V0B5_9LACO|nr:metalloregulator ArsR/SmtB family transcription factor [Companilactobacillus baiquanensis]